MTAFIVYRLLDLSQTNLSVLRGRVKQFVQHEGEEPDGQARHSNPVMDGDDQDKRQDHPKRLRPAYDPSPPHASAVVGPMIERTVEIRFAGKPPWRACSRTISSFGAM
jgi:hypothetical protein